MNTAEFRRRSGEASEGTTFLDASADLYRQAVDHLNAWAESATVYFRERRAADVAADVTRLARERPGQTLLASAFLGVLVGTLLHTLVRR
jgi:hypothetical protein